MKTAIVTDSNSGITQRQGEELGIYVLPMPFMVDGRTYLEGVDLTHQEFYEKMNGGADISTSQPSPASVMELWDEILKTYDEIVHIPMSSGLSSACQTAMMLAQDYEGRVHVVDNHRVSVTLRQSALDALQMAEAGVRGADIKKKLEETQGDSVIYITVDTLKYLKKGGRITAAAAALGTLLKIKPVLIILGKKLDAFAKARTTKQAKNIMISAIQKDLKERLGDENCTKTHIEIAHTQNDEAAQAFSEELRELFPEADIYLDPLPLSIACHIGPGSLALAATRRMER